MVMMTVSNAEHEVAYNNPPAQVAEAIQKAFKSTGKVKTVNRQAGRITGRVYMLQNPTPHVSIECTISKTDEGGAKLSLHAERVIGADHGGCQKGLDKFLVALSGQGLNPSEATGW